MVISQKLKAQLKTVQCTGNSDPEKVINLKIRVRNIVTRLETMGMGAALTHDSEFLSSVYCALPDRHKLRWLEYPKAKSHWDTMLEFLDKSYDMATHELALLSVYTKTDPEKKNVKLAAVNASENGELNTSNDAVSDEDEEVSRFRIARRRAKDACGICPVCHQHHTWLRRDGFHWPSDRMVQCKKFSDMNIQQRAAAVESARGCGRCTAWGHQRKDCKMTSNNCGADIGMVEPSVLGTIPTCYMVVAMFTVMLYQLG